MGISVETRTILRHQAYAHAKALVTGRKYGIQQYAAGDLPNWTEEYDHCKSGDLLRIVYTWVRMSIFDDFFLKEDWRIILFKHLERIKGIARPTQGYYLILLTIQASLQLLFSLYLILLNPRSLCLNTQRNGLRIAVILQPKKGRLGEQALIAQSFMSQTEFNPLFTESYIMGRNMTYLSQAAEDKGE